MASLAADSVERVELEEPREAVTDAGAETELFSIHEGEIAARNNDLEDAGTFSVASSPRSLFQCERLSSFQAVGCATPLRPDVSVVEGKPTSASTGALQ